MSWRRFTRFMGNKPKFVGGSDGVVISKMKSKPVPKKVKKYVKRALDAAQEDKFNYFVGLGTTIPNDVALLQYDLCATTKGDNAGDFTGAGIGANRHGIVIRQKRLEIRMVLRNGNPTVVGTQYVRAILAYDLAQNGAQTTFQELFMNATANQLHTSPINPQNRARYRILKDFRMTLSQSNATALSQGLQKTIKIRLKNRKCYYNNGNAGTYADINKGGLKLFLVSNTATASNPPTMDISLMLYFEDA